MINSLLARACSSSQARKSGPISGVSTESMRFSSVCVTHRAAWIPPSGPQSGKTSSTTLPYRAYRSRGPAIKTVFATIAAVCNARSSSVCRPRGSSALSVPMRELRPPARINAVTSSTPTSYRSSAIRSSLFALRQEKSDVTLVGPSSLVRICSCKPSSFESVVDLRLWRKANGKQRKAALCVAGTKCAGLGNAAVDFDGYNASSVVQFEGCWSVEHSVAVQSGQCDKHPVLDACCRGIAFQEGEGVIVAAHLGQHEAEVGHISGFRHGERRLDGEPRLYLISLDLRFEANVILESRFRIERTPINLK